MRWRTVSKCHLARSLKAFRQISTILAIYGAGPGKTKPGCVAIWRWIPPVIRASGTGWIYNNAGLDF